MQVARCRVPASLANHPEPTLIVDPPTGELGRHVRMEVAVLLFGGPYRTVTQALLKLLEAPALFDEEAGIGVIVDDIIATLH